MTKRFILILLTSVMLLCLVSTSQTTIGASSKLLTNEVTERNYQVGDEILELRDQYSKTIVTEIGRSTRINLGSIHYEDVNGDFQEINTTIVPSDKPLWDWEVETGHWQLFVNNDGTVLVKKGDNWIGTKFTGIAYLDITTKDYTILQTVNAVTPTVSGNSITWANILYGVDFVLYYTNDSLKEDIIVRQEARDLLSSVGHRPSDYGYLATNTYLVMVTECDWNQGLPMKLGIGTAIDPNEAETDEAIYFEAAIEDRYFPTKLISFLPVYMATSANPINPEDPEEIWEYAQCVMKKRLVYKNDKHWLLTGVPVLELNSMPEGSIIFDPTETLRPNANGEFTDWTNVGEVTCYACVNEIISDDDVTYIRAITDNEKASFYFPVSGVSGTINNITVKSTIRQEKTVAPWTTLQLFYAIDKTIYPNEDLITLTDSYVEYVRTHTLNPATDLAWTIDDLNAMQWGFNVLANGNRFPRDTQVYIEIDSTQMGWVSPTGFVDSGSVWTDETLAYDRNIATYAYANALKGAWTDYLELTCPVLDCDKVRIWVNRYVTTISSIEIDVYYNSTWNNIFSGSPTWGEWQEHIIGSTQSVTAMRIRLFATKASTDSCRVYEADFYEIATPDITNLPSSKDFGAVSENNTYETGLTYFTVTNNSSGAVTITIKATDFTGGDGWVLSDTAAPSANTAGLKAGLEGGDYTIIVKKTETFNTLVSGLAAEGTQKWGLKLYTPTTFSDGVQKSTTVTLTATLD